MIILAAVLDKDLAEIIFTAGIHEVISISPKSPISQNYPNPFNPATTIQNDLPKSSGITIDIFDLLGRKIETLVNGRREAGHHSAIWDGQGEPSGIYFYKIQAGHLAETGKMLLLK